MHLYSPFLPRLLCHPSLGRGPPRMWTVVSESLFLGTSNAPESDISVALSCDSTTDTDLVNARVIHTLATAHQSPQQLAPFDIAFIPHPCGRMRSIAFSKTSSSLPRAPLFVIWSKVDCANRQGTTCSSFTIRPSPSLP